MSYSLVAVIRIDVFEWCACELWREVVLHPHGQGQALLESWIGLGAFIFVLLVIPNLKEQQPGKRQVAPGPF